eukprot:scaffold69794_cov54-Cyclotella_meneghiniana.AAC.1
MMARCDVTFFSLASSSKTHTHRPKTHMKELARTRYCVVAWGVSWRLALIVGGGGAIRDLRTKFGNLSLKFASTASRRKKDTPQSRQFFRAVA